MTRLVLGEISFVVADKGHDTGNIRNFIKSKGVTPIIPLKEVYLPNDLTLTPEDFYDTKLYRKQHIIERLFGRLKENKRIAMRLSLLNSLCKFSHKYLKFYPQILSKNEPWLHSNFGWA